MLQVLFPVLSGLALFLYGMTMMGDALQKTAGNRMKQIIEALTKNKAMQILVGIVVTAIIQSSSATTLMVIGFVNADIMTLSQACGVIIGANVGTTVTGQLSAFDLSQFTPIAIFTGVFLWLFTKNQKYKDRWEILIGFGILFLGMDKMSQALSPLTDKPWFTDAILKLNNPILGVLVGTLLTTVAQSSSAGVGLLQALGRQGLINIHQAFPILLGTNIGTTTTALISSIGANRNGKRAALIHLLFNTIGTIIFLALLMRPVEHLSQWLSPGNVPRQIANSHTLFNVICVFIALPFMELLVKAVTIIVPGKVKFNENDLQVDERLLETPSIALIQARHEVVKMAAIVLDNFLLIENYLKTKESTVFHKINEEESDINKREKNIVDFLVQLSNRNISDDQHEDIFIMQDSLNDLERMGDHVVNISELFQSVFSEGLDFSDLAKEEFLIMYEKVKSMMFMTFSSFDNVSEDTALKALEIEDEVDKMEREYRYSHIRRINKRQCDPTAGVRFLDILSNLERISDHCVNMSNYVLKREI